jgi:hypothetical protein
MSKQEEDFDEEIIDFFTGSPSPTPLDEYKSNPTLFLHPSSNLLNEDENETFCASLDDSSHGPNKGILKSQSSISSAGDYSFNVHNSISKGPTPNLPETTTSRNSMTFLSRIKKSAKAVASAASRGLGITPADQKKLLDEINKLGIPPDDCEAYYERFDKLSSMTNERDSKMKVMNAGNFVIDCVNHGKPARLSDAAFRVLDEDSTGSINKYQYTIGAWLIQNDNAPKNFKWYEWRRKIIFKNYCKNIERDAFSFSDFNEFLEELGSSQNPDYYSLHAKWQENFLEKRRQIEFEEQQMREAEQKRRETKLRELFELEVRMKAAEEEYSPENLAEELIKSRLQLAQQSLEHESLQMSYRELERKLCELKMENRNVREHLEEMILKVNCLMAGKLIN